MHGGMSQWGPLKDNVSLQYLVSVALNPQKEWDHAHDSVF